MHNEQLDSRPSCRTPAISGRADHRAHNHVSRGAVDLHQLWVHALFQCCGCRHRGRLRIRKRHPVTEPHLSLSIDRATRLEMPKEERAIAIRRKDWDRIRRRLESVKGQRQEFSSAAWAFIAIAISAIFAGIAWDPAYRTMPAPARPDAAWVWQTLINIGICGHYHCGGHVLDLPTIKGLRSGLHWGDPGGHGRDRWSSSVGPMTGPTRPVKWPFASNLGMVRAFSPAVPVGLRRRVGIWSVVSEVTEAPGESTCGSMTWLIASLGPLDARVVQVARSTVFQCLTARPKWAIPDRAGQEGSDHLGKRVPDPASAWHARFCGTSGSTVRPKSADAFASSANAPSAVAHVLTMLIFEARSRVHTARRS
jgi:hypothetical protein